MFAKFTSSLAGPDDPIWMYPDSDNLHYEGELVIVIGKTARNVTVEDAPNYILGVTAGNDVTERGWQRSDLQWVRGKGADSFSPVGPYLVTGLDYNDLLVETRLNGETRQSESTASLIHSVDDIVSYVSRYITLQPGDLIFTGTPGSTQAMEVGDVVEIEVEGVGVLQNTVSEWTP
ncbi:MAG: fumarylacetoacetate hydrolase family protein [Chloroflexota bacterium]